MPSDPQLSELKAQVAGATKRLVAFAVVGGWATVALAFGFAFGGDALGAFYRPALAVAAAIAALCDLQVIAIVRELGRLRSERAGPAPEANGSQAWQRAARES